MTLPIRLRILVRRTTIIKVDNLAWQTGNLYVYECVCRLCGRASVWRTVVIVVFYSQELGKGKADFNKPNCIRLVLTSHRAIFSRNLFISRGLNRNECDAIVRKVSERYYVDKLMLICCCLTTLIFKICSFSIFLILKNYSASKSQ